MFHSTDTQISKKHKNELGYIDPTVAGIDIGDKVIYVAFPDKNGRAYVKHFGTTTDDLHEIAQQLKKEGVITAVMEATGVYWVPLYDILESLGFQAVLVDAKSVKNVPGRKTDVVDCQWIQTLYSNGLLRAAFRPPKDRLKLRAYKRQRMNIIKAKQVALLHMEKALQLMNIKLSTAVSDINSLTGMSIIQAIVDGEKNPVNLARLRKVGCKNPEEVFVKALRGNFLKEYIFALKQALDQFKFSISQLEECDRQIQFELESLPDVTTYPPPKRDKDKKKSKKHLGRRKPRKNELNFDVREVLWRKTGRDFTALPGIEASTALLIFSELGGIDVSAWKSAKEFASWLKLSPGNNISGGRRRKSKKQPCANYITQALRMAALAAKKSDSAVGSHIRRITGRTDKPKGIKAGAHKLAVLLYGMCKEGWNYYEKGEKYYEEAYKTRCLQNLRKRAKAMGFELVEVPV